MVKGVRAQGPGRKEAREGRREGCFRSPISHRMVKPETSGHERCQMGLERAAIGPGKVAGRKSRQPEEAESQRLMCQRHRAPHGGSCSCKLESGLETYGVFGGLWASVSLLGQVCTSQPNPDELYS